MLIEKEIQIEDPAFYEWAAEDALCFDIETTGLNKYTTHTTVIGTGFVRADKIVFRQWLLDNPKNEAEMLAEFSAYLKQFRSILQFNGASFDIPFVRKRCERFGLPDPFSGMDCIDLYRSAKRLKAILGSDNLKQKSLEKLFHIERRDRISGRDCIFAYQDYLRYGDAAARDALLLHNEEDVTGLLRLTGLLAFGHLSGSVTGAIGVFEGDDYVIRFSLNVRLPFPAAVETEAYRLDLSDAYGRLTLYGTYGTRRYYFANYKDYFYIPGEDHAIHRSVGIYVDKDYRVRATRSNCYEKVTDLFYYQPEDILSPALREDYKDVHSWISRKDLEAAGSDGVGRLCAAFLSALFR